MVMTKNNIIINKHSFVEQLKNDEIKCHKLPNHGKTFSGYREKISNYHFSEYLYSLRHLNDIENSGGIYLG